jgi:tRNA wybutosine-synthesizing protein 2
MLFMRAIVDRVRMARVPREDAESFRRELKALRGVRRDRKILEEDGYVLLPLEEHVTDQMVSEMRDEVIGGVGIPRDHSRSPMDIILERLDHSEEEAELLPRKWELLGDVLMIRLPPGLEGRESELAQIYAEVLGAKTVCEDVGGISGPMRRPNIRVILGQRTETVHRENGILYEMDVAKMMFSSGNMDERRRMAELDCRGETVVDMFAGIGYFTLPIAVHGDVKRVIACEINPDAQHYLARNVALNHVEERVEIFRGDNRSLEGKNLADRVIMGYVGTMDFLPHGIDLVREGGIIHFHDTVPIDRLGEVENSIFERGASREIRILSRREVKSYAPAISHYVWDLMVH